MSSSIESSPASSTDAQLPTKKEDSPFDSWFKKFSPPKWAVFCIGVVAVLSSLASFYAKFVGPWMERRDAVIAKETAENNAGRQKFDAEAAESLIKKEKAEAERLQFREYHKHFSERARKTQRLFDEADLGSLVVEFYNSDGCLRLLRRTPGPNQPQISHWIPAASITELPPGKLENVGHSISQPPHDMGLVIAQIMPATFSFLRTASASVSGNCWNPHPGEFRWWHGEQRGCWLAVWRAWPDGCQHYQWFNTCNGYWDIEPNGAPRVYWTNCSH